MKRNDNSLWHFGLTTVLFFLLTFLLPGNQASMQQYHLSSSQYHLLLFMVQLPLILIWFTAFYGSAKLQQYAQKINDAPEAGGMRSLALGARWLAWGLPAGAYANLLLGAIANQQAGFVPASVIITNYVTLFFTLIGFMHISEGARNLLLKASLQLGMNTIKNLQLVFVIVGVVYCYLTFRYVDLHSLGSAHNPYYLPVWLLVLTLLIPYLYAWFIGFIAVHDINMVAKHTKGVLYRQALRLLAAGIAVVIASFVASQYVRLAIPRTGAGVSITTIFVVVYILYFVMAAGFSLVAAGAQRLKRIEDV